MKTYRVQFRYKGKYYDAEVKADDDFGALVEFFKLGFQGKIEGQEEPLYNPDRYFVTTEEVNNGSRAIDNKEAGVGVQMGITGVSAEASNS